MASSIPPRVRRLAADRAAARESGNYIESDAIRDELAELGWQVLDSSDGFDLQPIPRFERVAPASVRSRWDQPPTKRATVIVVHEGFLLDLARFLGGMVDHHDLTQFEILVVDPATSDGGDIEELSRAIPACRTIHLDRDPGWAATRNLAVRAASGEVVVLADLSIEPTGDVLTPVLEAFASDSDLAVAGPIGIVTVDLREWQEAATPVCDAIEGYLLAFRRDLFKVAGPLDERFTWYRNADLALSLQLREVAAGSAKVVEVPLRRHEHRGYSRYMDEAERDRQSKRNYNLLLDRWRDARHLLTGAPSKG